jgi:hypothetical protein
MKKIVLFFNIPAALFLLNAFSAHGAGTAFAVKMAQTASAVYDNSRPSNDNLVFDACFEGISDDNNDDNDDSNNDEGKKMPSEKTTKSNKSFVTHNFSDNYFKNSISTTLHLFHKTPLFIFIRVLRL